jgi:hypothetical protein
MRGCIGLGTENREIKQIESAGAGHEPSGLELRIHFRATKQAKPMTRHSGPTEDPLKSCFRSCAEPSGDGGIEYWV